MDIPVGVGCIHMFDFSPRNLEKRSNVTDAPYFFPMGWGTNHLEKKEAGRPPECSFLLIYEIEISQVITNVHHHIKT